MNGVGEIPERFVKLLRARASQYDVGLQVRVRMSERDKFVDLKKAQLLVFPSLFEGFGLPPVEAQYCGTRVLAFDLPVLREVNRTSEGIDFVTKGDGEALKRRMVEMVAGAYDRQKVRSSVSEIATFEKYVERLDQTITNGHTLFLRRFESRGQDRR
jgi:glycosyltransferase involved in cell wall biosynthesis